MIQLLCSERVCGFPIKEDCSSLLPDVQLGVRTKSRKASDSVCCAEALARWTTFPSDSIFGITGRHSACHSD